MSSFWPMTFESYHTKMDSRRKWLISHATQKRVYLASVEGALYSPRVWPIIIWGARWEKNWYGENLHHAPQMVNGRPFTVGLIGVLLPHPQSFHMGLTMSVSHILDCLYWMQFDPLWFALTKLISQRACRNHVLKICTDLRSRSFWVTDRVAPKACNRRLSWFPKWAQIALWALFWVKNPFPNRDEFHSDQYLVHQTPPELHFYPRTPLQIFHKFRCKWLKDKCHLLEFAHFLLMGSLRPLVWHFCGVKNTTGQLWAN